MKQGNGAGPVWRWSGKQAVRTGPPAVREGVCATRFVRLVRAGFGPGAHRQTSSGSSRVKVVPWAEEVKPISP